MSENVQLLADENVFPIDEARCNIIDGRTREIKMAEGEDFLGVETDRNSERRYFKCPKIVGDNIDLSFCQMYVGYVGASDKKGEKLREEEPGRYHCDDVFEEGDYIYFSWRLSGNVFKRKGFVAFNIYAVSNAGDEAEIVWNTTLAVGTVKMSIPKGTSALELYPDVINQLFERLLALEAKIGNGGGTSFSGSAADVSYDDTKTGLDADNVQDAIKKISDKQKSLISYNEQTLTDEQQAQVRENIGVSGTVEIGEATKENTVLTVNSEAEEVTIYSAEEIDNKISSIPTKLSQMTEDSTHRTVTDAEKRTWNDKSDFSGSYNDLTNKPTIPTIPTSLKNPCALTFNLGNSKYTYDGSNEVSITIEDGNEVDY